MIKIRSKVYNDVLEIYVINLDNGDSLLASEAELQNELIESEFEKFYAAVRDGEGTIIGFELQESLTE